MRSSVRSRPAPLLKSLLAQHFCSGRLRPLIPDPGPVPARRPLSEKLRDWLLGSRWVFLSPHTADQCEHLLRDGRAVPGFVWPTGIYGRARRGRVKLHHKQRDVRNSFVPVFYGRIESQGVGSRVVGRFRMHLFTRVFAACWVGMITLPIVDGLTDGGGLVMVLMLAFFAVMATWARFGLGSASVLETVEYIRRTVDGEIETSPWGRTPGSID
jgi:hypothetical protein